MKTIIKILLAALYFGCLLNMPYGYFQIVRIASLIGFIFLFYFDYTEKNFYTIAISIIGIILYNPIDKITFKRYTWNVIDVIFAVILLVWAIIEIILILKHGKKERATN